MRETDKLACEGNRWRVALRGVEMTEHGELGVAHAASPGQRVPQARDSPTGITGSSRSCSRTMSGARRSRTYLRGDMAVSRSRRFSGRRCDASSASSGSNAVSSGRTARPASDTPEMSGCACRSAHVSREPLRLTGFQKRGDRVDVDLACEGVNLPRLP